MDDRERTIDISPTGYLADLTRRANRAGFPTVWMYVGWLEARLAGARFLVNRYRWTDDDHDGDDILADAWIGEVDAHSEHLPPS